MKSNRSVSPQASIYPRMKTTWRTGKMFLDNYQPGSGPGKFFIPYKRARDLPAEARINIVVSVIMRFSDRAADFHVHARVLERRTETEPTGLLLQFLDEEQDREQLVLACAKGEYISYFRRRHRRTACHLRARILTDRGKVKESTAIDISEAGVGLVTDQALKLEMPVNITLSFPDGKDLTLPGRVASVVLQGPQKGVGVEFLFDSTYQRNETANQIKKLQAGQFERPDLVYGEDSEIQD
jgi:hypothetical protein